MSEPGKDERRLRKHKGDRVGEPGKGERRLRKRGINVRGLKNAGNPKRATARSSEGAGIRGRRLAKALVIVVIAMVFVWVSSVLAPVRGKEDLVGVTLTAGQSASSESGGVLAYAKRLLGIGSNDLPRVFAAEVGVPAGARDVRSMGNVVGYVIDDDVVPTFKRVVACLEGNDWLGAPFGGTVGAVFSKEGGMLSWAIVTCTRVSSATSVVVRYG